MLAAGIIFFQDRDSLRRCLDSLRSFDLVIAVDGAFTGYESENRLSTDGSREVCKDYPNVVLLDAPNLLQHDKRTRYLQRAGATHLLVIDSEEWIEGDAQQFRANLPHEKGIYSVDFWYNEKEHYSAPRLICQPDDFEYYGAHCILRDRKTGNSFRLNEGKLVEGITLHSDDSLRTSDYQRMWQQYIEWKRPLEAEVKRRYG